MTQYDIEIEDSIKIQILTEKCKWLKNAQNQKEWLGLYVQLALQKSALVFAALNASELRDELVMTALDGPYKSRSFHLR